MRQGCPLSPLLIIFVLEVLLRQIQESKEISGLKIAKTEYKYRAYVDDVLFITENPKTTVPKLLNAIKIFGELAEFYLNYNKTKILCKDMTKPMWIIPLEVLKQKIEYGDKLKLT